jgi:hypothetical protein
MAPEKITYKRPDGTDVPAYAVGEGAAAGRREPCSALGDAMILLSRPLRVLPREAAWKRAVRRKQCR